ncbi:hypothetical protein [Photobacterium leiognathi]|uniref:hypothetical protein n=1 Tax=Photobacterium leiognathi TaxID=553611 RepID=UPI0029815E58|nr:hypothetical protein [Photobacterium leiognathi]
MNKLPLANKFQMHYYFNDDSHSMDALVRNRCEAEIISIITDISNLLDENVLIEREAYREGGLRDIWKLANDNAGALTVIIGLATLIIPYLPKPESELELMQKEDLRLSIEERKLNIKQLKAEIRTESVKTKTIEKVAEIVSYDYKIVTRKSNLYKHLNNYNKVTKFGVNGLYSHGEEVFPELQVPRSEFNRFILNSNMLPVKTVDEAIIEIVSPVLKQGNYKWKGIFEGSLISFSMKDDLFKNDVLDERVSFQHGSAIKCALNIYRKLDEIGEIVVTGYSVETVLENMNGGQVNETSQGKAYRQRRMFEKAQGDLFIT